MELHVGTSGFSYKEWKGTFYPEDLPDKGMLSYYGERLGAVEINNTFYRLPKTSVLESWAEQVPDGFRFSIKASRKITHFTRLKAGSQDPTEYLLSALGSLGDRLGVLLFQLPPNFKKDIERLSGFLGILPEGTPAAWEFRHESWYDDEVYDLLRDRAQALVCADTEEAGDDEPILHTAPWGYLRLRRPTYDHGDLERWARSVAAQEWERAFIFFKHEDEGAGTQMADRFARIAGEETS